MRVPESLRSLMKLHGESYEVQQREAMKILDSVWLEAYQEGKAGIFESPELTGDDPAWVYIRWLCGDEQISDRIAGRLIAVDEASRKFLRDVLEALCRRDGLILDSSSDPGKPARNYELILRLGIGEVLGFDEKKGEADG